VKVARADAVWLAPQVSALAAVAISAGVVLVFVLPAMLLLFALFARPELEVTDRPVRECGRAGQPRARRGPRRPTHAGGRVTGGRRQDRRVALVGSLVRAHPSQPRYYAI
jgi:hypothetical protein